MIILLAITTTKISKALSHTLTHDLTVYKAGRMNIFMSISYMSKQWLEADLLGIKNFSSLGLNHDLVNPNPMLFLLSPSQCSCANGEGYKKHGVGVGLKDLR